MKASALRDMTQSEIEQKIKEFREALFNLTFQQATGQMENTAQLSKTRRSIARALTVLRDKQQNAAA
jgi:large subunit ribosomal protein L29